MELDAAQLRAFDATVSAGTLEGAARALRLTPSAVSQRLKALETAAGRVLFVRTKPVRVTESGETVLRLARQLALLTADTARQLGQESAAMPVLPLAVNADSLATWVLPALAPLAGEFCFDLYREDEEHTSALLRRGIVMAAITTDAEAVPGCAVSRLGAMRYRPMASRTFAARWFADGVTAVALARAPVVVFDRKDDLQDAYLRRRGVRERPPVHFVPSSADFLDAVHLGLGWGMALDLQLARTGYELVDLDPAGAVDVVLHWQQWRLRSPSLDRVAAGVLGQARVELHQPT
jgi:LysR family transcriptional regulator, chromosome initiation inhibitor